MTARYVWEGTWGGYHAGQKYVCHRTVVRTSKPDFYKRIQAIVFTDSTTMTMSLRPAVKRERVSEVDAYSNLLWRALSCDLSGFVSVTEIERVEKERREKAQAEAAKNLRIELGRTDT